MAIHAQAFNLCYAVVAFAILIYGLHGTIHVVGRVGVFGEPLLGQVGGHEYAHSKLPTDSF